jgi:hypothetical protein
MAIGVEEAAVTIRNFIELFSAAVCRQNFMKAFDRVPTTGVPPTITLLPCPMEGTLPLWLFETPGQRPTLRKRVSEKSSIHTARRDQRAMAGRRELSKLFGDDGVLVEDLVVELKLEYW